jgi:hypothetical protein
MAQKAVKNGRSLPVAGKLCQSLSHGYRSAGSTLSVVGAVAAKNNSNTPKLPALISHERVP